MPRKKVNLAASFSDALAEGAETHAELQTTIDRLRSEIAQIKAQGLPSDEKLSEYRNYLKEQTGEFWVAIEQIAPNPTQARQTITQQEIVDRAASLEVNGQLDPIILVPTASADLPFMLEDGELRWRAATYLVQQGKSTWEKLKAVQSLPGDDLELHRRSLLHSLHNQALNPLDKAEAIVKQALADIPIQPSSKRVNEAQGDEDIAKAAEFVALVRALDNKSRKPDFKAFIAELERALPEHYTALLSEAAPHFDLEPVHQAILKLFLKLQVKLSSFAANELRMLSLFPDLKIAVRQQGLGCFHAARIQKVSAKNLGQSEDRALAVRSAIVAQVVKQNLSIKDTEALVKSKLSTKESRTAVAKVAKSVRKIDPSQLSPEDLNHLAEVLSQKLDEIQQNLQD